MICVFCGCLVVASCNHWHLGDETILVVRLSPVVVDGGSILLMVMVVIVVAWLIWPPLNLKEKRKPPMLFRPWFGLRRHPKLWGLRTNLSVSRSPHEG